MIRFSCQICSDMGEVFVDGDWKQCECAAPLVVTVSGTPRPQPRPRFIKGRAVSTADPKAKLWREVLSREIKAAVAARGGARPLFGGAVRMRCVFTFKSPSGAQDRLGTPHTLKPDASNLLKLVEDVAEQCGVFKNDSQLAQSPPEKWWGAKPGVVIIVESMAGERRDEPATGLDQRPDWLTGR